MAMGSGAADVSNCDGVMTLLRRLPGALKSRLSGCQVRRRHASSAALDMDSLREKVDPVGDDKRLPLGEEKTPALDELIGPGPKRGRPSAPAGEAWNGLTPDGTLNLRPGVLVPVVYML